LKFRSYTLVPYIFPFISLSPYCVVFIYFFPNKILKTCIFLFTSPYI
jgi:hypothetical protein